MIVIISGMVKVVVIDIGGSGRLVFLLFLIRYEISLII